MKRFLCVVLLSLSCILTFTACVSDVHHETETSPAETDTFATDTQEGTDKLTETFDGLIIASDNKTDYLLIKPVNITADISSEISSFTLWFSDTTGANLYTDIESAPIRNDKEIVVNCSSDSRADAKAAYNETAYTGYDVRVCGNRIIVTAHSEIQLKRAFGYLRENIVKIDDNTYAIDKAYKRSGADGFGRDVSKYETARGVVKGVYHCGNDAYEVNVVNTSLPEAQAYVSKLKLNGFSQYAANTMGENGKENYFYTLTSDSATVFVNYYNKLGSTRIVIADPELYLPSTEKPQYKSVVTPSVSQTARAGAGQYAPGTSIIFQLSDASFIIVDGGPNDKDDCEALMDFFDTKTPGDAKPVISAWMLTHSHSDHIDLACSFINDYHDRVDIRMVAYNFPDFNTVSIKNESMSNAKANSFISKVKRFYPDAEHFIFHAGQKLYLADAEIEILFTHEDLYPNEMLTGNHSSSMWTVTVNGQKTMILGDSERSLCQQVSDCFGSYLKSDILQVSHHGFNGACLDLYMDIDPDICFWSCDQWRFQGLSQVENSDGTRNSDRRTLGETANGSIWEAYNFNYWLRNSRERQHYHAQQTKTIFFTTK